MFFEFEFDMMIFRTAVSGTERNIPTIPHRYPHINKEIRITSGFKPRRCHIFLLKNISIIFEQQFKTAAIINARLTEPY
jgi:hypothetical protein